MSRQDYDRYALLNVVNEITEMLPFVTMPNNSTDKYEYWNSMTDRYDKFAQKYYGNPFYDFLILYANPLYTSEYDIPDDELIRIPFPFSKAKSDYEQFIINNN
jgi:hypothetical protein